METRTSLGESYRVLVSAEGEGSAQSEPNPSDVPEDKTGEGNQDGNGGGSDGQGKNLDPVSQAEVQARIDALTANNARLERELQALQSKKSEPSGEPEYSEAQLMAVISDEPDAEGKVKYSAGQKAWATRQLTKMDIAKAISGVTKDVAANQERNVSYSKAVSLYPELDDPKSTFRMVAVGLMKEMGLDNHPNGPYLAAMAANNQLYPNGRSTKKDQKKNDKEFDKKNLNQGGGGGTGEAKSAAVAYRKAVEEFAKNPNQQTRFKMNKLKIEMGQAKKKAKDE